MSKIQNWKQFTTSIFDEFLFDGSVLPCQRYKIESNSQQYIYDNIDNLRRFYHVKDTKLKAIHNQYDVNKAQRKVGFTMSKIQNWKQFTTQLRDEGLECQSVLPCQRYKIESNSQLKPLGWHSVVRRFYHVKDTKLKAIHNYMCLTNTTRQVGFTMSKIQNWKQFTTIINRQYLMN